MKIISKNIIFSALFTGCLFIITVILIEFIAAFLLNHSTLLSGNLLNVFRMYYIQKDRKLIQYLPDCAGYDKELSYTLKPGKCHIEYREFDIDYSINSAGLRDDEISLTAPKIIVAGDSHSMGWGVNHDERFSELLEKKLGKSVLNTAVSSYGTVRELKILERVNLDNLEYLIIQYNDGDFGENKRFLRKHGRLSIMSEEEYHSISKAHHENTAYYFGKHFINLISIAVKKKTDPVTKKEKTPAAEVNAFLYALSNSSIDLSDIKIIVFEINGYARNDSLFINKVNERLLDKYTGLKAKSIKAIDFSSILGEDKYFRLDDHINPLGHQSIAEAVAELIISNEMLRKAKNKS